MNNVQMVLEAHFAALKILPGKALNGSSVLTAVCTVRLGWPLGTSGDLWGLSTCCAVWCSLSPGAQEAWARGRLAPEGWVRPSRETWVEKIKIPSTHNEETLHFFSFGDCQCDNLQKWKGSACKWRKRESARDTESGREVCMGPRGRRPRVGQRREGRPQGVGGSGLVLEARTKTSLSDPFSVLPLSLFPFLLSLVLLALSRQQASCPPTPTHKHTHRCAEQRQANYHEMFKTFKVKIKE